ncbi:lipopolysaccharide biosynthesis protein [Streptomyces gamaensis]|uniref:Lipopolysaccharide biosynthesis protein n=1 Tax=Streptomyces gamaensis TaxID=1763542 RepID=A0ABW0YTK3_9ACTN
MSDTSTRTEERHTEGAVGRRPWLPGRGGGSPLFRNAFALMLNTGISAVLGLGYWLIAARYYTESAVGQGSAAIAAMKFLAGLAAVTLTGALARFIPIAGRRTARLVLHTYAGSSLLVALAALVFLYTLDLWGPSYRFLHGPWHGLGFMAAVAAWAVLTLQDGVLTGLRSALWVPVGNTVFSAVKLVLLVALAVALPTIGVFFSWVVSIAVSVVPLGWLVFRRLVPRHVTATERTARPVTYREMGRFLAGDCTGSLFSLLVVYLVPVLVASQVSSTDNAYFYITSTIAGTTNLLAINMGASLTVEGSHDPARLADNCRAALRRMARIMVPVCLAMFFLAPYILRVFGEGYEEAATPLLRWFAVGAALRVVMEVYFAVLRAQSRTAGLAYLQGLLCVLVLGLTLLLLPRMGLTGAGVAEISSLTVIVSIAAVRLRRVLRASPAASPLAYSPEVAPDGDLADLAVRGDKHDAPREHGHRGPGRGLRRTDGPEAVPIRGGETPSGEQSPSPRYGTRWALRAALDADTVPLTVRPDFEHPERRPDPRPTPEAVVMPPPHPPVPPPSTTAPPTPPADPAPATAPASRPARETKPPGERASAPWWRRPETGVCLLLAAALALYWTPLAFVGPADLDRMGGLGLITVLPAATLAGAGLLALAFAGALWLPRPRRRLLAAVLVATVVCLHAVPAVLETQPRFATAWQHLGFLDYIDRTGLASQDLDARWSWPGFFALAALAARACGITDVSGMAEVLRWWPVVLQLLCLAPLMLLLKAVRAPWRAKWTAAWLFVLCGWVGQDYFSPQSLNYFFYLLFVAVLLVWFRYPRQLRGRLVPGEARVVPVGRGTQAALLGVLLVVFAASVASHQLTPGIMLGVATALVLTRRCTLRGLPLWGAVLFAAWVSYLAEPYWSGHFKELFGGLGSLGGNVSSSVSGRIEGGSQAHKFVLYVRVLLAAGLLGCAALGWWRRRRAGIGDVSLLVLTAVPFLAFGMQSYGGEMALRVFLFAVPGACVLAALALFPGTAEETSEVVKETPAKASGAKASGRRPLLLPLATLAAGLVLTFGFLVARWGNESFERVRPGEVAAMDYVYAHDEPTVKLLWMSGDPVKNVTPALPWGSRDMEHVQYQPTLAPRDPSHVDDILAALRAAGPHAYLIVDRGQSGYLQLDSGYAPDWYPRLRASLDTRPELTRSLVNPDAALYELRDKPPGDTPEPHPGPPGPRVRWTPMSVTGALAALALLVLLAGREVVRVAGRPGVRQLRWLQGTYWFALPLLGVVVGVLVQRFASLS